MMAENDRTWKQEYLYRMPPSKIVEKAPLYRQMYRGVGYTFNDKLLCYQGDPLKWSI